MPWRGPAEPGEFPTLAIAVGDWIQEHCVIPDGPRMGEPYLLTDEMWRHLLWAYRLDPAARGDAGADAMVYGGTQLVRPQKWGKDPFMAVRCVAHALGPVQFAGWDAAGEPVGAPHPSAWVCCAATAEDQTDNTFRPIVTMLREGPLSDTPGLDIGETRVKLPTIGWIEPITASAKSKLGGRFTFVSITESHLLTGTGPTGGVTFGRVLRRNVAGMSGMWTEGTNAWDPSERSLAQLTYEAKAPDVWVDYRPPRSRVDIEDEAAVLREVIYLYGDSAKVRGGWVPEQRILAEIRNPATGESEARRYFLNEIAAGASDAINPTRWDALARPDEDPLVPGDVIALGFDGSRSGDATALRACRLRDRKLFHIGVWVPAEHGGQVPRLDVDRAVKDAFEAYEVRLMLADPPLWQNYLDAWSALYPKRVVDFPTSAEIRMDRVVERFLTAVKTGEVLHDGHPVSTQHARNAALSKGKRKPGGANEDGISDHYLRVVKKRSGQLIDDFVAGLLAYEAAGQAIEDGALVEAERGPELW